MVSIPRTLENALLDQYVVPFVGAGVSRSVKRKGGGPLFPTWMGLLLEASTSLESDGKMPEAHVVRGLLGKRSPDYLAAARYAREGMGSSWYPFLREQFDRPRREILDSSLDLPRAIWKLPSRLVVTTNYDQVLRFALDAEAGDMIQINVDATAELSSMLRGRIERPTVWHLHGQIQDTQRLILTPDGYNELYPNRDGDTSYNAALSALRYLLAARTFLFIGFSLDDERFGAQISWVERTFSGAVGPHYMLVRTRELPEARRRLAGVGSIEFLPFEDYGEPLVSLIEELAAVGRASRAMEEDPVASELEQVAFGLDPAETGAATPASAEALDSATIRRSYRLVYRYQRRLFDRLTELSNALSAMGLAFERWDPALYSRPAKSTTEFFRRPYWAWDFLPAYHLRLVFSAPFAAGRSARRVVVDVVADDGFRANPGEEPDPRFFAQEGSRSELRIDMMRVADPRMSLNEAWELLKSTHAGALADGHDHDVGMCSYRVFRVDIDDVLTPPGLAEHVIRRLESWFGR